MKIVKERNELNIGKEYSEEGKIKRKKEARKTEL